MKQHKMIIGGESVGAVSANWETVIDPSLEEAIAEVPQADYADVDRAVQAASSAFTTWSKTSPAERSTLLYKLADALEAKAEIGRDNTLALLKLKTTITRMGRYINR